MYYLQHYVYTIIISTSHASFIPSIIDPPPNGFWKKPRKDGKRNAPILPSLVTMYFTVNDNSNYNDVTPCSSHQSKNSSLFRLFLKGNNFLFFFLHIFENFISFKQASLSIIPNQIYLIRNDSSTDVVCLLFT